MEEKRCPVCGMQSGNGKFCDMCGAKLTDAPSCTPVPAPVTQAVCPPVTTGLRPGENGRGAIRFCLSCSRRYTDTGIGCPFCAAKKQEKE